MEKVLVIGAARSGVAVAQLLVAHGFRVVLTDTRAPEQIIKTFPMIESALSELSSDKIETVFGSQIDAACIDSIDRIVISPGVPLTIPIVEAAFKKGIPVQSEVELAFSLTDTPFVAITGTNGKTTTTTLTGEIFNCAGRKTYTVGNIGDPISNYVDEAESDDVFVTEISSFQLQTCYDFKPKAAAILNLSPDHLDRHKTLENYYQTKAKIFKNQTADDYLVLNAEDPDVCRISENAAAEKIWFSYSGEVSRGAFVENNNIIIRDDEDKFVCTVDELGIKGPHNVKNALAAVCLTYFMKVPVPIICEALTNFKGVEHRQERFATIKGVEYINDSKGTNTDAAITALKAMTRPVILIAGGYDKKENYDAFILEAKKCVKKMILIGATANDIERSAHALAFCDTLRADDFDQAVKMACDLAVTGDTVLLSPACASWDMFDNYEIRGKLFKELVDQYGRQKE